MKLVETEANPAPAGADVVGLVSEDGVPIRAAFWKAEVACPSGTVLLLQGRAEFIEKYFETVGSLRRRGYAVATFDWRGQGGSGRLLSNPRKGHIADFSHYGRDLDAVSAWVAEHRMPAPVHVLAHSMGGCIALLAASERRLSAERLMAVAPMVGLSIIRHPRSTRALLRVLLAARLHNSYVPGGHGRSISTLPFSGNRLSADPARYDRNRRAALAIGPGAVGAPTIGWLGAAYRAMDRVNEPGFPTLIRQPVVLVAAGSDPVCSTGAITALAERLGHSATVIADARHEILMETDQILSRFWAEFDRFFAPGRQAASN